MTTGARAPRRIPLWAALAAPALLAAACAHAPQPEDPSERALYRDLQRLVTLSDSAGWEIDRLELEELRGPALLSLCRVERTKQDRLLDWLDLRAADLGGPVEVAYRRRGRDLGELDELLEITRIAMLLRHTIGSRDHDCPFWLEPEAEFDGEQIPDDRWQLTLATGGKAIFVSQGGRADINFGGAGRLLFGRAFGPRWSVYVGAEAGAVASFPRSENGGRSGLVLGVDGLVPVVVRYRFVNTYLEVEAGYLAHVTEERLHIEPGVHAGVAVGAIASRRLLLFPGAAFAASYERTFPAAGDGAVLQSLKLGVRVVFDVSL